MLKINKKVEYALMALKFMAQKADTELTSAREICDKFETPFDTTAKVMQQMNNTNILQSVKGIKGGYHLAKPLCEITFLELIEVIEGKKSTSPCESSKGLCELYEKCNIASPLEGLNIKLNQFLTSISVHDVLFNIGKITFERSECGQELQ